MDWKECCGRQTAKRIKPDIEMVKSLVQTSEDKWKSQQILELSNVTASSKFSLAYDSIRELLEALSIESGYKIYNHECYTAFLKEILSESAKGDAFDEIRKIRNGVNYYGKQLSVEEAEATIKKIVSLRESVIKLLKVGTS